MRTRSRKVLQETEQKSKTKIKKGSKPPEVADKNETLKKTPVSPILGSRKRRQATQLTELVVKINSSSSQRKLKTAFVGSRKSQQAVKSKSTTPILGCSKSQQVIQVTEQVKSNSRISHSKPETPIRGSRKRQHAVLGIDQTIKTNTSSSESKSETPVLGSRKRQHAVQGIDQTIKTNTSSSESKSETPVLGNRKRKQTVKGNSSLPQSKPKTQVHGSRKRQHAVQGIDHTIKSSVSQSKPETPILGSRKRKQAVKGISSSPQSKPKTQVHGSKKKQQPLQVTDLTVRSGSSSRSVLIKSENPGPGSRKRRQVEKNIKSTLQMKPDPPIPGSNKRSQAVQSSSNSSQNISDYAKLQKDSKNPESNSKTPVWRKIAASASPLFDFKTKRQSSRISLSKNKDIYEFPCEDNKGNVIKKKKKPQVRRKKLKPRPMLKTMLTTDPLFEPTISKPKPITASTFYAKKKDKEPCNNKIPSNIKAKDMHSEIELADHSEMYSHYGDDIDPDDAGYEASISVANDTEGTGLFLADPALSVFPTQKINLPGTSSTPLHHEEPGNADNAESSYASLANPALSILPTPKTMLRYPGTSSTPFNHDERYNFNPFTKNGEIVPHTHEQEVKLCFGFDDAEDVGIGISPVKKSKQLTVLHQVSMASFSNVEVIDPVPTRFRGMPARPQVKNFKRPVGIENTQQIVKKKRVTSTKEKKKMVRNKSSESKDSTKDCDKSVLFDEELEEFSTEMDRIKSPRKKLLKFSPKNIVAGSFSNSPEKSFIAPPRKSYDRKSLESIRQKFHKEFAGGYPTTDTDTDEDTPSAGITRRKRKIVKTKPNKNDGNSKMPHKTYPKKRGKVNKENCTPPSGSRDKKKIRKNGNKNLEKTVPDWASDINSHFSEIDDMDLVIE